MTGAEEWRKVVGYEGVYDVSSLGRVRSVTRPLLRSNGVLVTLRSQVLKPWFDPKSGYSRVHLQDNGRARLERVHRLVAQAFLGPGSAGEVVRHKNGDARNSAVTNLEWGTESENMFDTVRHGHHFQSVKTVCPRGHELAEPNLRASTAAHGWRGCLSCKRAGDRARTHPDEDFLSVADGYYALIMGGVAA